jgi:hypothetical protein
VQSLTEDHVLIILNAMHLHSPTNHKIRQAGQNAIRVTSLAHLLHCVDGSTLLGYLGNFLSAQDIKDQLKGRRAKLGVYCFPH